MNKYFFYNCKAEEIVRSIDPSHIIQKFMRTMNILYFFNGHISIEICNACLQKNKCGSGLYCKNVLNVADTNHN